MRIEPYSAKYFNDVFKVVENFHAEAVEEYDSGIDVNTLTGTITGCNPENSFLLIAEDGSCQGVLYGVRQKSITSGQWIFQEVIWYVNKAYRRYGLWLLSKVEKKLKSEGVGIMIMAVLENSKTEKLKRLYKRIGYRPMETHYVRSL